MEYPSPVAAKRPSPAAAVVELELLSPTNNTPSSSSSSAPVFSTNNTPPSSTRSPNDPDPLGVPPGWKNAGPLAVVPGFHINRGDKREI